jgi:hypothetical protein
VLLASGSVLHLVV